MTDSTSTIDPDFAKDHHIYIVPLRLIIGTETYKESVDISNEEVYEKLRNADKAGSSQPPIGEFVELYETLKEQYDEIIVIHCSSELSGTFHNSVQAAEMAEAKITAIDSKAGAFPLREMIMSGVKWQQEGLSAAEIKVKIEQIIEQMEFYLIPFNLQRLHRSGRVSGTQLLITNLLKIHLLLTFDKGKVVVNDKIRTFRKAKDKLLDILKTDIEKIKEVCIMHANNMDDAIELKEQIKNLAPTLKIEVMTFIPVVGILTGEGTLALSWIRQHPQLA